MPLTSLVYVSLASHDMSDEELKEILRVSRENNAKLGLTGMLLYRDGFFIQALEGEKGKVHKLYDKIKGDGRHRNILTAYENDIEQRAFDDWSMGFNKIRDEDLNEEGVTDFLQARDDPEYFKQHPGKAARLLDSFKHKNHF